MVLGWLEIGAFVGEVVGSDLEGVASLDGDKEGFFQWLWEIVYVVESLSILRARIKGWEVSLSLVYKVRREIDI